MEQIAALIEQLDVEQEGGGPVAQRRAATRPLPRPLPA